MKKMYKQPEFEVTDLQTLTVLCASTTFGGETSQFDNSQELIND